MQTISPAFDLTLDLDQMIATREVCASGRALRALLSDSQWGAYRARVREVLGNRFPGGIRYQREVCFAVGYRR